MYTVSAAPQIPQLIAATDGGKNNGKQFHPDGPNMCYNCNTRGHFAWKCPIPKEKPLREELREEFSKEIGEITSLLQSGALQIYLHVASSHVNRQNEYLTSVNRPNI